MFSEQDVDRELRAALTVSPSPDFEARVLRRVEADRASHWPAHYGWLAAAASFVLVAGVIYALSDGRAVSPVPAPRPASQSVEQTPPAALPRLAEAPIRKAAADPRPVRIVRAAPSVSHQADPQVIVPVNQMEAVRRLVRAVTEGRIEVPAEPQPGPMTPPPAVTVTPVIVEPIPLTPLAGAGGQ